jgi:maltooligosyltrehalose trehalohydrolase
MAVDSAPARFVHEMPFGAAVEPAGGVRFRLPSRGEVRFDTVPARDGWREVHVREASAKDAYCWILHGDTGPMRVPDPASHSNPDGVHGPELRGLWSREWATP